MVLNKYEKIVTYADSRLMDSGIDMRNNLVARASLAAIILETYIADWQGEVPKELCKALSKYEEYGLKAFNRPSV